MQMNVLLFFFTIKIYRHQMKDHIFLIYLKVQNIKRYNEPMFGILLWDIISP